jgi:hypothetical protein
MTIIIYVYHDNMIHVLYYIYGCKLRVRYKTAVVVHQLGIIMMSKEKKEAVNFWIWFCIFGGIAFLCWLGLTIWNKEIIGCLLGYGTAAERGQFGDSFGWLNTLFSGLAFAALVATLFMQKNELELQRQDLEDQKLDKIFNLLLEPCLIVIRDNESFKDILNQYANEKIKQHQAENSKDIINNYFNGTDRNKNKRLFKELVLGIDTVCRYLKKQFDDNPNNRNEYKDLLTYLIGRRYSSAILFGLKENQDWMKKSIAIEEFEKNCLLTIDDLLKCEDNEE